MKKEKGLIKEEVITPCIVEDTVYVQGEVMKEEEIKEENVCIKEEVHSPTEGDTCTVYVKEEDVNNENTKIKGMLKYNYFNYLIFLIILFPK